MRYAACICSVLCIELVWLQSESAAHLGRWLVVHGNEVLTGLPWVFGGAALLLFSLASWRKRKARGEETRG